MVGMAHSQPLGRLVSVVLLAITHLSVLVLSSAAPFHGNTPPSPALALRALAVEVSKDGTCGNGVTCLGSGWGVCCSSHGFCGASADHCGTGCDAAHGRCGDNALQQVGSGSGSGGRGEQACETVTQRVTETWWRKAEPYTTTTLTAATTTATVVSTSVTTVTAMVTGGGSGTATDVPTPLMPRTRRKCEFLPLWPVPVRGSGARGLRIEMKRPANGIPVNKARNGTELGTSLGAVPSPTCLVLV
jgi:hypothetical protein